MYFALGVIFNFALGFGTVSWYLHLHEPRAPMDAVQLLNSEPAEYRRIHQAFLEIGKEEADEFERVLVAYDAHRDKNVLRQEAGGLVYRALDSRQDILWRAGLSSLERMTRETVDLMRRYSAYGEAFCSYSIERNYVSAERLLAENRRQQETVELIEEFKQARFELVVLSSEVLVESMKSPVNLPNIHQANLQNILIASASREDAAIIRRLRSADRSCRENIAVLETALAIEDDDDRRAVLAHLRPHI